jgi:hypothetical protein
MKRNLWLLLVPALLMAGTVRAQVAIPELTPAAPRYYQAGQLGLNSATITADNPAALAWGEPTELGLGLFKLDQTPVAGTKTTFNGYYGGYRGVGDKWSFGLEGLKASQSGGGLNETALSGHLAYQIFQGLALGAGVDQAKGDNAGFNSKVLAKTLGLSVNVGKTFYLGYAIGSDDYDDSAGTSTTRDSTMLGVALRLKGSWLWHIAYDSLDKKDFGGGVGGGFKATTITLQANTGTWLLGVEQFKEDPQAGGGTEFKANVFDLAYAPEKGWSVGGRLSDGKNTSGSVVTSKDRMLALNLAYRW